MRGYRNVPEQASPIAAAFPFVSFGQELPLPDQTFLLSWFSPILPFFAMALLLYAGQP
jgi:hypothetical protein